MGDFKKLNVWIEAKDVAVDLYRITNQSDLKKDFGLRDQLRRAGVSIASNIAEGDELGTNKQSIRFFHIAKGSSAEVITQLMIAEEIGYLDSSTTKELINRLEKISAQLNKLIQYRTK